ncbi:MBL fold metallo-hydrolase [Albirhodobacter sp. R86504]|uniref:MBL fold metallo-hydrolase n=1 Tax=Albirhodobacter sp. R86504 TaxID=3093848 RepID=UPI00366A9A2F
MTTQIDELADGLIRLRAPNAGPMTFSGTNSYLIGRGSGSKLALIDPGPEITSPAGKLHFNAILGALHAHERISHIFVTHAHRDHSPLARPLAEATGAEIFAFGNAKAGRSATMRMLATQADHIDIGGGEGVDHAFEPDVVMADGAHIASDGWGLTALHTPGHFCNHLCFAWNGAIFSGDHVMGWSSTLISPPDGDLADYYSSLDKIEALSPVILYPGHGDPVDAPVALIRKQRAHRETRTRQILAALQDGPATAELLAKRLYAEIPPQILAAATRNTLAHLIDLALKNKISHQKPLHLLTEFQLT